MAREHTRPQATARRSERRRPRCGEWLLVLRAGLERPCVPARNGPRERRTPDRNGSVSWVRRAAAWAAGRHPSPATQRGRQQGGGSGEGAPSGPCHDQDQDPSSGRSLPACRGRRGAGRAPPQLGWPLIGPAATPVRRARDAPIAAWTPVGAVQRTVARHIVLFQRSRSLFQSSTQAGELSGSAPAAPR